MSPTDADAWNTKMKDERTHLAHKAEHAVDLGTGAVMAVVEKSGQVKGPNFGRRLIPSTNTARCH